MAIFYTIPQSIFPWRRPKKKVLGVIFQKLYAHGASMQWLPHQTPLAIAFSNYDDFLYYSPKYSLLKKAEEWIPEKNHIYWNIFQNVHFLWLVAKNEPDSNAKSH